MTTKTFTTSDIDWGGSSHEPILSCSVDNYQDYKSGKVLGYFTKSKDATKKITNLPPHWSIFVRFDLIFHENTCDDVKISIDGSTSTYVYSGDSSNHVCTSNLLKHDEVLLFSKNLTTHSQDQANILISSDSGSKNGEYSLKNFFFYVDQCHQTCASCNGPTKDKCITCPTNSSKSGNSCACNQGFVAYQNECIVSCPSGYITDSTGLQCVIDFCYQTKCSTCVNKVCTACKVGYLLEGECISSCPSYTNVSGRICQYKFGTSTYGKWFLRALHPKVFGDSEIKGTGFKVNNFYGQKVTQSSGALVTLCESKSIIGGTFLASDAQIYIQIHGLSPHYSISFGQMIYFIDTWEDEEEITVKMDSTTVDTKKQSDTITSKKCGLDSDEDAAQYDYYTKSHTSSSLLIKYQTSLTGGQDPYEKSYGIREFFLYIRYCPIGCAACSSSTACSSCQPDYTKNGNSCDPDCDDSCLTCSDIGNQSCLTCKPNTYLNPDNSCQNTCPDSYFKDSDWKCQQCDSSCFNCLSPGDGNSCTQCNQNLYLTNSQCTDSCSPGSFKLTQTNNNICQDCHLDCKTCDGPDNNNCLSCYPTNHYWQYITKTCETSCSSKQYKNDQSYECTDCGQECISCIGPDPDQCLKCTGVLKVDCSYNDVAVLNPVLSKTDPILTIDFGMKLNTPVGFQQNQFTDTFCQYLFTIQTLQLIGQTSVCQLSGQYVIVNLDDNAQVSDGDILELIANKLTFYISSSIDIQIYKNNIVIQDQITGQPNILFDYDPVDGDCIGNNIIFQSITNDAKRGFKQFEWFLQPIDPFDSQQQIDIQNLLQEATNQKNLNLVIPKGMIKINQKVTLKLGFTLKANVVSFKEIELSVIPKKKIFFETQSNILQPFYRTQSGMIMISYQVIACDQIYSEPLDFQVSCQQNSDLNYHNAVFQEQQYTIEIKPYAFTSGQTFIKLNGKLVSDLFIEQTTQYELNIQKTNLFVKISCSRGYFSYKSDVILKTKLRDYEIQSNTEPSGIDIEWKCTGLDNPSPCVDKLGNLVSFTQNKPTAEIKAFTFVPYTTIKIELIGKKDTRESKDTAIILLSELDIPILDADIDLLDPNQELVNLNEEINVVLKYDSQTNIDLLSFSGTIEYENKVEGIIKFDYLLLRFQLWNYFSSFNPGSSDFSIRFSVFNPNFYMPSVFLQNLKLNFPPKDCQFSVTPNQGGFSLETLFVMKFKNCNDDHLPISYQFFYYLASEDFEYEKKNPLQVKRRQLSDRQQNSQLDTILPSGDILVLAQAIDSRGAIYNITVQLDIQQRTLNEQTYLDVIQQNLNKISIDKKTSMISILSIMSDDINQRKELKSKPSLNDKKIEIINQLNIQLKTLPSISTFSTVVDKSISSLIESGISYNLQQQNDMLNNQIQTLEQVQALLSSNKDTKEKLKQKLYDCFQILDKFKSNEQSSQSDDKIIELIDKIGDYLFKNILPNEDPIFFKGENLSIFGTQITEKYTCSYFLCGNDMNKEKTTQNNNIYNFKTSRFENNPYSKDESFLNYTNQLKQQNPQIQISSFPVITPKISIQQNANNVQNLDKFSKQVWVNFQSSSVTPQSKSLSCLSKDQNKVWVTSDCRNVYNQNLKEYSCLCNKLSPTTILDDLGSLLLDNENINTAFSSQGIENISNFKEFYKYAAFWILSSITLIFIKLYYKGQSLDKLNQNYKYDNNKDGKKFNNQDFIKKIFYQKNKIVPLNNIDQQNNDFKQREEQQILETKASLILSSAQDHQIVIEDLSSVGSQSPDQKINIIGLQIRNSKDSIQLGEQCQSIFEDNQKVQNRDPNIQNNTNIIRKGETRHSIFKKNDMKVEDELIDNPSNLDLKSIKSSQNKNINFDEEQYENKVSLESQNQINVNTLQKSGKEKIIEKPDQINKKSIFIESQEYTKLPIYKQILIFHTFAGIFLIYNPKVSRGLRFLIFYLKSVHTLSISVVFDEQYNIVQKIAIAVFNSLILIIFTKLISKLFSLNSKGCIIGSRILAAGIILGYYYIIFSIISGLSASESNKFIGTFSLVYLGDVLFFNCIFAACQRLLAKKVLSNQIIKGFLQTIFNFLELELILFSVSSIN